MFIESKDKFPPKTYNLFFEYDFQFEYNNGDYDENALNTKKSKFDEKFKKKNMITDETLIELKDYDGIYLGHYFNQSIDILPDNIKNIYWYDTTKEYDFQINKFPSNLEILDITLCDDFESSLNNPSTFINCLIPETVKILKLPYLDIKIPNLPLNVEVLEINNSKQINDFINIINQLNNLKKLSICIRTNDYDENIKQLVDLTTLPENLEFLEITNISNIDLTNLPNNLKTLIIANRDADEKIFHSINKVNFDNLPAMLSELCIDCYSFNLPIDFLPNNLKKLTLSFTDFTQTLDNLPLNLEILELSIPIENYSQINFTPNLKNLTLKYFDNEIGNTQIDKDNLIKNFIKQKNKLVLPKNLINLSIDVHLLTEFDDIKELDNLVSLELTKNNKRIKSNISFKLPKNLKYLKIDDDIEFEFVNMPYSLEVLILGDGIKCAIPKFPSTLKTFYLSSPTYWRKLNNFNEGLTHLYLSIYNDYYPVSKLPNSLKSLYVNCFIADDFIIPPNLTYFGFVPLNKKFNQIDTRDISEKEYNKKILQFNTNILNNIPDSVEIFSTELELNKYKIKKLPKNLKEFALNNYELYEKGFDLIEHLEKFGCDNNFDDILFYFVQQSFEIDCYYDLIDNYFDTDEYLYDYK